MAWTDIARREHKRDRARYPSDLTDREWALIAPLLPAAKRGGRPRTTCLRAVMDAILYIASTGCQWRALPKCFPLVSTIRGYFYAWRDRALFAAINHLLVMVAREQAGKETSPTAGIIDSQSVKTTESGGISGYDAGNPSINSGDQGPQAPHHYRHARLPAFRADPCRRYSGQGRRSRRDRGDPLPLSLAAPHLRRWRLCRPQAGRGACGAWRLDARNRQAVRRRHRLRRPAAPMGRRADIRLARAPPPHRQGLGKIHRKRHRMDQHRIHPPDHTKNRKALISMTDF